MNTQETIAHFGNQTKTGEALGIDQSTVSCWGEYPPDRRQLQIERVTFGALKAEPGSMDRVLGMDKIEAQSMTAFSDFATPIKSMRPEA